MSTVSAVVTVRDDEDMLGPCLELLGVADEIVVVVDSRTVDRSAEVARRHTERVLVREFDDFAGQKNFGIESATGDWVLVVDADERVTPALAAEIRAAVDGSPSVDGFEIRIQNYFYGRLMQHGGWTERNLRLIRRSHARLSGAIHERPEVAPERTGSFLNPLWHFSHRSVLDNLRKTADYIDIQADEMIQEGHPPVTGRRLFSVLAREFFRRLIRERGWRDGMPGVIESLYQPFSMLCLRLLIWERQQTPSTAERYEKLEREAAEAR